jgi:hypothetical protein
VEIKDVRYRNSSAAVRADTEVQVLTEDEIKDKILENIKGTEKGDSIDLGMFYLSHREIIRKYERPACSRAGFFDRPRVSRKKLLPPF